MKDLITSIVVIALSLYAYIDAERFSLVKKGAWNLAKNPAVYPRAIAFVMFVLGVILLINTLRKGIPEKLKIDKEIMLNVAKIVGLTFVYVIAVFYIGFIAATTLFIFAVILVCGGTLKSGLIVSLPITLGLYVVFKIIFNVPLPMGEILSIWG